jgi:hypothetical protein
MPQARVANRRTAQRFPVEGIVGECIPEGFSLTVLNISTDGLALRLEHEVRKGEILRLRLQARNCPPVTVEAEVIHAMRMHDSQGAHFIIGAEFIMGKTGLNALEELIGSID